MERIRITVDPELEDLIPGFMANRQMDVQKLEAALQAEDYDRIRLIGHSMKGAGGGYGFDRLTEIGAVIESAALERDVARLRSCIDELADYLARVDIVVGGS